MADFCGEFDVLFHNTETHKTCSAIGMTMLPTKGDHLQVCEFIREELGVEGDTCIFQGNFEVRHISRLMRHNGGIQVIIHVVPINISSELEGLLLAWGYSKAA